MENDRPQVRPFDRAIRLGVLISGSGTTLLNLLNQISEGMLNATVNLVIASRADCGGIAHANAANVAVSVISRRDFRDTDSFSDTVFAALDREQIDLVVLAGYLSLLRIPEHFAGRVMNIHPSLLPAFSGKGFHGRAVHAAAIERGVRFSGCTVHFADNHYDQGPIILQEPVPVAFDDSPESLAKRVFAAECRLYPEAIRLYAAGRLTTIDRKVQIVNA